MSDQQKNQNGQEGEAVPEKLTQREQTQAGISPTPKPKATKKRAKERVQLDFSPESLHRLDQVKDQIGANTRSEVVRTALRVLEYFASETKPNDTITITDELEKIVAQFKARLLYGNKE